MSNQDALFHSVKDDIHFDTLLEQAHQVIEKQAEKLWSDTAEHDPGITFLQGISYGVSDLAYRHTLPLKDLLTPAPDEQQQEGIFPAEFGPHNTLTCGPVTADDYRKALLDLHSSDSLDGTQQDEGDFLFRSVQLVREPEKQRYTYWYDATKREYSFVNSEGAKEFTLRGNYWLYLEPTRWTQGNIAAATRQLTEFLTKNRNIGESVSNIIWLQPVDLPLLLDVELDDDVGAQDVPGIFAAVYSTAEQYLMPGAQRYRTEVLQNAGMSNDQIFEGPLLEHGWIPELPAARDYTQRLTLNLSRLVNSLLEIEGIKHVNRLRLDDSFDKTAIEPVKGDTWSWSIKEGYYPRLWGEDPLNQLAQQNGPLRVIAKGGISVSVSKEQIQASLPSQSLIQNEPVILAYGQHRDVGSYYPVSDTLPPCYGLQHSLSESEHLLPLHQFMLPFEQLLACGCQQIAMLPRLLAFQREGYEVWGDQWPFKSGSVNDDAHQDYAPALKDLLGQIALDSDHELDIINYLLGYFGTQRAPRTFTTQLDDFRAVQQGYLAQQPTLTYHRSNIRIDQVSSLQKRIAARMGLGGELFKPQPDLSQLPFYLIEHRALLPVKPNSQFDKEQKPASVTEEGGSQTGQHYVVIEQKGIDGKLTQGQVINLILYEGEQGETQFTIRGQMVFKTEGDKFWLDVNNSAQLEYNLARVMTAAKASKLFWQNSPVWMEDMGYRLAYASDQSSLPVNQRRLTRTVQTPFPPMVVVGSEITLLKQVGIVNLKKAESEKLYAKVVSFDRIEGTLIIERLGNSTLAFPTSEEAWRYSWYFSGEKYERTDRFSFVISVVVNSDLIKLPGVDPYKLEEWVKETILTEFPAHISMIIHWMDREAFLNFANTYQRWQNNGTPLGDAAYSILESLTLGKLPSALKGVGTMRIATSSQREEVVGSNGDQWNTDGITQNELFYVPKES
ncbi:MULTISPECIES: hypothetical protein [Photorhabdus]|uniref:Uncharacterized protein n=2 Tax=Photorhabdus asymbiotica TaxID=291112 RepID=B6VNN3_PHOAA|nr:hypothetical protein [Photorhabdus asymbiotica]6J0N_P Chain P, Pvc12 [Photorhabdus asymbiotica subsp. asymbiotica ATCC 43949]6J0N_Q Chain Q, Pvc12 [Photorhabdus asymbiotica subsp. asymbiotica ATCC 43949]6J0N_R Chain R, Pvc12 [Photorhabdus asymbiotica subsp. asymbiotica ATCC 43949]6J0N_S Chain S, Pvc12 [Photorhabdus asymbiotica subsp. asymbiotica ATCC 43949]6J0N_T Chain T, Pvc12 [Photorhabdus asymbiotica subsp. asymbiotica ATCC 43949]6J0N_U Chain U, Pvc12 [Photorhabdus asymbiotica subsp. as